jgi:hypothetical protein
MGSITTFRFQYFLKPQSWYSVISVFAWTDLGKPSISQSESRCPGRDSNRNFPECKPRALPLRQPSYEVLLKRKAGHYCNMETVSSNIKEQIINELCGIKNEKFRHLTTVYVE